MNNDVKAANAQPCAAHQKWELETAAWRASERVAAEAMAVQDERAAKLLKGLHNGD